MRYLPIIVGILTGAIALAAGLGMLVEPQGRSFDYTGGEITPRFSRGS